MEMKQTINHEAMKELVKTIIDACPYHTQEEKEKKKEQFDQAAMIADFVCKAAEQSS